MKAIFAWCVRICAVATFGAGIYAISHFLIPTFQRPMTEYLVTGKSDLTGAYCIHFKELDHSGETMEYYFLHHGWFYLEVQAGDHLRVAPAMGSNIWGDGYRQLVRDGRIVARSFSDEQLWLLLFIIAALLPGLVFLPAKSKVALRVIWGVAVTGEVIVIGAFLFWAVLIYALGHSTGC